MKTVGAKSIPKTRWWTGRRLGTGLAWKTVGALALGCALGLVTRMLSALTAEAGRPFNMAIQSALVVLTTTTLATAAGMGSSIEMTLHERARSAAPDDDLDRDACVLQG